jgi:hypothetical protein
VVVSTDEELTGYAGISLAKVVDGPNYTHVDGHCVQAVWRLHDGREIPQLRLTAVGISELLESATDALRWLRNGVHPDRILPEMLRAHRAGSLARRTLEADGDPGISRLSEDDRCALRAMVSVSGAISELEISWREMVRSRLPNLVRSLYLAGALEISRRAGRDLTPSNGAVGATSQIFEMVASIALRVLPKDSTSIAQARAIAAEVELAVERGTWEPNTDGAAHPLIAGLAPSDLAAIGWRS